MVSRSSKSKPAYVDTLPKRMQDAYVPLSSDEPIKPYECVRCHCSISQSARQDHYYWHIILNHVLKSKS